MPRVFPWRLPHRVNVSGGVWVLSQQHQGRENMGDASAFGFRSNAVAAKPSQHSARACPQAPGHTDMETRGRAQMSFMRQELTLSPSLIFSDARVQQGHRRRLMAAPAA